MTVLNIKTIIRFASIINVIVNRIINWTPIRFIVHITVVSMILIVKHMTNTEYVMKGAVNVRMTIKKILRV
jgi:hypothetical protein